MLVYKANMLGITGVQSLIRTNQKKLIKKELKRVLKELGYRPWFLLPGLAYYAFEFWEVIVRDYLGDKPSGDDLGAFEKEVLLECGQYLDEQYSKESKADVIGYLKRK